MLYSPIRAAFVRQKHPLPTECQRCEWLKVCKSGCPRNRAEDGDGQTPDYFCQSYKQFLRHADARLSDLKGRVDQRRRYLHRIQLEPNLANRRNDACPCGSGRRQRQCCGAAEEARTYLFQA